MPPPSLTISLLHDTGTSKTDKITNNDTLTGTGAGANATVVINAVVGGVTVVAGTVTATAAGKWTFTPTGLGYGTYTYFAEVGANTSSDLVFTYIPSGTLTIGLLNGTPSGGTSNNDTLVGDAAPNGSVLIYQDGPVVATVTANASGQWTYTPATLSSGLHFFSAYDVAGNYAPMSYTYAPCYLSGTRLRTPTGWVAVESLHAGDEVLTADGAVERVRWMGHRSHSAAEAAADPKVVPVLIRRDAMGPGLPCRDLYVSPDHAVLLDGILVQAAALVNGTSVLRGAPEAGPVTYFHVELDRHALLLAEDLPAESFVDNVGRAAFDNAEEAPVGAAPMAEMDLPRAKSWRQVPRASRERLAARGESLYGAASRAA